MADFLISHMDSDQPWADWLKAQLSRARYRCRILPWNHQSATPLKDLCEQATAGGDTVIMLISPAYLVALHSHRDWIEVLPKYNRSIIALKILTCHISGQLGLMNVLELQKMESDGARDLLMREISTRYGEPKGGPEETAALAEEEHKAVVIQELPYVGTEHFAGRTVELSTLRGLLQEKKRVLLHPGRPEYASVGLREMALQFAQLTIRDYDIIWWVQGGHPAVLVDQLSRLARELKLTTRQEWMHPKALRLLYEWFHSHDRWLLVVEGANCNALNERLLHSPLSGHVLVTSTGLTELDGFSRLPVHPLSRGDAVKYLAARSGEVNEGAAAALAMELRDAPLALALATSFMHAQHVGLSVYLDQFAQARKVIAKVDEALPPALLAVETCLFMALNAIAHEDQDAIYLLQIYSFLNERDLGLEWLLPCAHKLPRKDAHILTTPKSLHKANALLQSYGLVDKQRNTHTMHPLTRQQLLRWEFQEPTKEVPELKAFLKAYRQGQHDWTHRAGLGTCVLECMVEAIPETFTEEHAREQASRMLPHGLTLLHHAARYGFAPETSAKVARQLGDYVRGCYCFEDAESLLSAAIEFHKRSGHMDEMLRAGLIGERAEILAAMGKLQMAFDAYQESLAAFRKLGKHALQDVGKTCRKLGNISQDLGRLREAEIFYKEVLEIDRNTAGERSDQVASDYVNLGLTAQRMGDLSNAWHYYEHALDILKEVYGPKHPSVSNCVKNLGGIYYEMGDYPNCKRCFERALAIDEQLHPPGHPEFAKAYNNLGLVMQKLGELKDARVYYKKALIVNQQLYGKHHPKLVLQYNNLATVAEAQQEFEEAERLYSKALQLAEATLGPEHDTAALIRRNLDNLHVVLGAQH